MARKPIDFYFWTTPNGFKVRIMLEECGLAYRVRPVDLTKGEQFKPAFLKISPNNKMPAIVDPEGPDGQPISVFESGAILQYLGRKTGQFYPSEERPRVEVDQWLFWQMGGLGPMAGQAHHFRHSAPKKIAYGIERYTTEVTRLYGVLDRRLKGRSFIAGDYSIADMACFPWIRSWEKQGQVLEDFPRVKSWLVRMGDRAGVQRGLSTALK
jgi:GST-like protein